MTIEQIAKVAHEANRDSWLAVKRAEGWQYGHVKDPAKKLHPCFVPYEALPMEQQVKDALFIGVVHALSPLMAQAPAPQPVAA